MNNIDLRSNNDNSKVYREMRLDQTRQLLKKALSYINSSDKNFSYKNICKSMEILATEDDKKLRATISASAISKNKSFRQIIETYKIQNDIFKAKQNNNKLSEGDLAFELHKCKTLFAQKSDEVLILTDIIKKEDINPQNCQIDVKKEEFDYKYLLKEAIKLMILEDVLYRHDGEMIVEKNGKLFANKQLIDDLEMI